MSDETESRLCNKIDNLSGRVDILATAITNQATEIATLTEKMNHPCEQHAKIDRRITRIEARGEGSRKTVLLWIAVGSLAVAAGSVLVAILK